MTESDVIFPDEQLDRANLPFTDKLSLIFDKFSQPLSVNLTWKCYRAFVLPFSPNNDHYQLKDGLGQTSLEGRSSTDSVGGSVELNLDAFRAEEKEETIKFCPRQRRLCPEQSINHGPDQSEPFSFSGCKCNFLYRSDPQRLSVDQPMRS